MSICVLECLSELHQIGRSHRTFEQEIARWPPNMKRVLSHLLVADCSHRAFISKHKQAYTVMNFHNVSNSFANDDDVGFTRERT